MISISELQQLEKKYYPNEELGIISQYANGFFIPEDKKKELEQYGITDVEYLIILMFCGNQASIFQQHFIEKRSPNELESALCSLLDSVLNKLPSADFECLGRFDVYSNIDNYKENSIIEIDYYLTTTPHNLGDVAGTKVFWLITPLSKTETQARCIYSIHDILGCSEYQVNFRRGTKFYIEKIDKSGIYPVLFAIELKA